MNYQPQIYGASAGCFADGTTMQDNDGCPTWDPAWANLPGAQRRTLRQYLQSLNLWSYATKVPDVRKGPRILLNLGGAARKKLEEVFKEYMHEYTGICKEYP